MQLDDLIKQERIGNVTRQTHISSAVLERMLDRNFKALKKPQVMGAISILEREYELDLKEFRDECTEYFETNYNNDNGLVVLEPTSKSSNFLLRFFVLMLIVLITYGGWYFFASYYKPATQNLDPQNEKTLIDIILEGKDTIIETVSGKSSDSDSVEVETSESVDQNTSPVEATTTQIQESQKVIAEEPKKIATEDTQVTEDSQVTQESRENKPDIVADISSDEKQPVADANNKKEASSGVDISSIKREKITLLPQKVMNFQLVNLQTKRLLKFNRKDQYDIDVKDGSWLYSSKDTVFAFIDNDIFEEYGGEGKIFFRLDQNGIHPLTEDEYKIALN